MADTVITITDISSGNIDNSGHDIAQSNRLRAEGYIALPAPSPSRLSVEITASTGKQVDVELRGYSSANQSVATVDRYWVTSPASFDLSSYAGITFIRLVFRYSDNSNISPEEIESCTVLAPGYVWHMGADGYPTNSLFPELPASPMEKPYPKALWRINPLVNNGYPFHELLSGLVRKGPGAFRNAAHLTRVRIPETVKTIGAEAFRNTALRSVTIAPDCTYSETSFPEGCEVNFYGGGGEYGQLVDCNGVEILDCEAVRILVKGE